MLIQLYIKINFWISALAELDLSFYFFTAFIGLSWCLAWFAITSKTPIHGILTLICLFVVSAFLFITLFNLEFIGILLLVIYVGAVAVLFVFVVMILPTRDFSSGGKGYPIKLLGVVLTAITLLALLSASLYIFNFNGSTPLEMSDLFDQNLFSGFENDLNDRLCFIDVYDIGKVIYRGNSLPLITSAILLFVALVVAIILCDDRTQTKL